MAIVGNEFVVMVKHLESETVLGNGNPRFASVFFGQVVPGNFQLVQFHSAFFVEKPLQFARWRGNVLEVHLINGITDNLTALDELDFSFGRAGTGKQASEATHHSSGHIFIALRLDLQQGIYLVYGPNPQGDNDANNP